ncbi:MAG: hypothetical protein LBT10_01805 [Methanobrevibacter sp.]|jgi:hypothetical protein|nr:hypothetical protein [Methanobrevibacter sp.]
MIEKWKEVVGYEGCYGLLLVSNFGNGIRFRKYKDGSYKLINLHKIKQRHGYLYFSSGNAKARKLPIHRLIAWCFINHGLTYDEFSKKDVHHSSKIVTDNNINNLELLTKEEHWKFHSLDKEKRSSLDVVDYSLPTQTLNKLKVTYPGGEVKIFRSVEKASRTLFDDCNKIRNLMKYSKRINKKQIIKRLKIKVWRDYVFEIV